MFKADSSHLVPNGTFFKSTAGPVVHPGLLFFFRGSLGTIMEFVFHGLGYSLEMPQSFGRTRSGRGLELAGKVQNALLLRVLFWKSEQLPEGARAPFQMCCSSGADRKCWISWSCPSSLVNPSRVEPASPLEITAGGCEKQRR